MASNIEFKSGNADETMAFARDLATREYGKGKVFLLEGEVGSGKTTFVRGFVSAWELDSLVTSPTFTLLNEYSSGTLHICHFDFYRLNSADEVRELGFEDYLPACDYTFIEWPDIGMPLFSFKVIEVHLLRGVLENERLISITPDADLS